MSVNYEKYTFGAFCIKISGFGKNMIQKLYYNLFCSETEYCLTVDGTLNRVLYDTLKENSLAVT